VFVEVYRMNMLYFRQ